MTRDDFAEAEAACPAVSRETWERLRIHVDLLHRWQPTLNLVAPSTLSHVWTRHVADSLQLLPLAPEAGRWADLGSGGGFPGLVIAIALAGRDGAMIELVESDRRKAAFLAAAVRETAAPARVHAERIEAWAAHWSEPVKVVTARALAPLERLIPLALPLLGRGAVGLFPKGKSAAEELTAASRGWHSSHRIVPSATDSAAGIVVLSDVRPRRTPPQEGRPP
ncbi:MAG TPA: 16S rRNA (guanine(527)-N(7))-methyltransferase RsmG [Hyphomicrobiales bacterium]|nr:16S rRNA (guanine(527)-N(7))-methyltransferase RsmG [Hyphomicrobiales bacterium]